MKMSEGCNNNESSNLVHKIKTLENIIKDKNVEIFSLNEKIQEKSNEIRMFDKFMGFSEDMSLKDKKRHTQKCDREEKKMKEIVKDLDPSLQEEYEKDLLKEEDIVDLALKQNQLQYEIHENFNEIKDSMKEKNVDLYKQYKREFLSLVDKLYNMVTDEYKNKIFDTLIEILEKENQVYEIDEIIKNY